MKHHSDDWRLSLTSGIDSVLYLSAVFAVCQLPPSVRTSPPAFDVRSSDILCGWPDGLEFLTWHCFWSDAFVRQFTA